ncbi:MAG: DivIVA domain-containing protein [Balneolaceae bacterium]|nr:DivIVA domain-containing protein [Balneolaceae bacterium]MBO6545400.1 DivIVA domain-containing protein [Balneolaceae bacterium]MBO6646796.1 DivIVA domain-containing protein [Balneolaceae bacterium]
MKLTPLEIKQQQFEKSLRGYDVADVQAFLTLVSNEYEHLLTKNKELDEQIEKLSDRVRHYERVEEALHETLQTTKESLAQKMDNARLEAKNTTDKAQMEAESIISEANQQRNQIRQSILRLLDRRDEIIAGISSYLDNAKNSVDKFSKDEMSIFTLPSDETEAAALEEVIEEHEEVSEEKNGSRFALDEEELGETEGVTSTELKDEAEDDNAFPPGTDRLNDILDEID